MRRTVGASALGVLLCVACVLGAHAGAGRTGAPFLEFPHRSVRATGVGEAFVTYDGDVNTMLWNPAGLSTLEQSQVLGGWSSFAQVFGDAGEGLYYGLFAGAMPIEGLGAVGFALQLNGQGTIDITTNSPQIEATESLGTNWAFSAAYAESLTPHLRAGLSGKIIRLILGTGFEQGSSATAYAFDAGLQYDLTLGRPMTIGASLLNVGTRVQFKDANQSDPLPRKFHGGIAVTALETPETRLVVSLEAAAAVDKLSQNRLDEDFIDKVNQLMEDPANEGRSRDDVEDDLVAARGAGIHAFGWSRMQRSIGAELMLFDVLSIRGGYMKLDQDSEPPGMNMLDRSTFGFGLNLVPFGVPFVVDYVNAVWGAGGPTGERVNSFALSAAI